MTPFVQGLVTNNRKDFNPSSPLLSVLHKFDGWRYEQEWRAVLFTPGIAPDQTSKVPTPSRVFLGSKMDLEHAKEIAAICVEQQIEVWQMALAKDKFELVTHPYAPVS
jgi:hypothetical protein